MHPKLRVRFQKARGVNFRAPGSVFIGGDVYFDELYPQNITIGANVYLSEGTRILAHFYQTDKSPHRQRAGRVIIEDDVFLGFNVVVAEPVTIGRGAVVGANTVVTRDVDPWTVVAGVPARKIKDRVVEE